MLISPKLEAALLREMNLPSDAATSMLRSTVSEAIKKHNARVTGELQSNPTKELTPIEKREMYGILTVACSVCVV